MAIYNLDCMSADCSALFPKMFSSPGVEEVRNGEDDRVEVVQLGEKDMNENLKLVVSHFRKFFQREPEFLIRVPGRVNLIGEHVDYCGYSVCPMALEQSVLLAISRGDGESLRLTNLDSKYSDYEHPRLGDIGSCKLGTASEGGAPNWHEYFLCGVRGALEAADQSHCQLGKSTKNFSTGGMLAAVSSDIPPSAGLSSSSALVSGALLAMMIQINDGVAAQSRGELADLSARAERHIGTQGGGMDQAIAFLARAGSAKHIAFNPLRAQDVQLPASAVFVIGHSQADHNKAAGHQFNQRVLECRLAAQVLAKKRVPGSSPWESVQKLSDVQLLMDEDLRGMVRVVEEELVQDVYSLEEVCGILEASEAHLKSVSKINFALDPSLKLRQRALHVFEEANRVIEFQSVCEREDLEELERLRELGNLMSASHSSLRGLYECSHPRLDELVSAMMDCGALGARLTGAGWGGCAVALTTSHEVDQFVLGLKQSFYSSIKDPEKLDGLVFKTEPRQGAMVYHLV